MKGHLSHINVLLLIESINKNWLISGSWDKNIIIWSSDSHTLLKKINLDFQIRCIQFNKLYNQLLIGSFEGEIHVYNINKLAQIKFDSKTLTERKNRE